MIGVERSSERLRWARATVGSRGGWHRRDRESRVCFKTAVMNGAVGFVRGAPRAGMDTAANAIARARDIIAEDVYVDPARSHSPPKPRAEAHPAADADGREACST